MNEDGRSEKVGGMEITNMRLKKQDYRKKTQIKWGQMLAGGKSAYSIMKENQSLIVKHIEAICNIR